MSYRKNFLIIFFSCIFGLLLVSFIAIGLYFSPKVLIYLYEDVHWPYFTRLGRYERLISKCSMYEIIYGEKLGYIINYNGRSLTVPGKYQTVFEAPIMSHIQEINYLDNYFYIKSRKPPAGDKIRYEPQINWFRVLTDEEAEEIRRIDDELPEYEYYKFRANQQIWFRMTKESYEAISKKQKPLCLIKNC